MASPMEVDGQASITFTEIEPLHRDKLVEMHEELFPVNYSNNFYTNAVQKIGIRGGHLFSSIAFQKRNGVDIMVGFVMAQFIPCGECDERFDLFDAGGEPPLVFYILTLGIEKAMRRTGLGTELLRQCVEHASFNSSCGAVSLFVLP
jgi:ribosomal protein S18 acetylase RimI-like enzyme